MAKCPGLAIGVLGCKRKGGVLFVAERTYPRLSHNDTLGNLNILRIASKTLERVYRLNRRG